MRRASDSTRRREGGGRGSAIDGPYGWPEIVQKIAQISVVPIGALIGIAISVETLVKKISSHQAKCDAREEDQPLAGDILFGCRCHLGGDSITSQRVS